MNNKFLLSFISILLLVCLLAYIGCKKDENPTGPNANVPTYPVTAKVYNPQGLPQGGATLTLLNPPSSDPKFSSLTDSTGTATIQSPAGQQTLLAKLGSVFQATMNVTVAADTTPTVVSTPLQLHQVASLGKILVVQASAEQLEDVLRVIGFTTFDSTDVYALRDSVAIDSTKTLTWLQQYKLIFSDCDGGSEQSYPLLSRVYGRYVAGGGKIYGGHYNYYNLAVVWTPYFQDINIDNQGNTSTDTLQIVDANLQKYVGIYLDFTQTDDSRHLSGYEKWSSFPPSPLSHTYGVIKGTNPAVGVIVECYPNPNPNGGKYLWTDYHNQDIKNYPNLVKIVNYFLLNM